MRQWLLFILRKTTTKIIQKYDFQCPTYKIELYTLNGLCDHLQEKHIKEKNITCESCQMEIEMQNMEPWCFCRWAAVLQFIYISTAKRQMSKDIAEDISTKEATLQQCETPVVCKFIVCCWCKYQVE